MKDSKETQPINIVVDPTKLVRCRWCRSIDNEDWFNTSSGIYCSGHCHQADQESCFLFGWLMLPIPSLVLSLVAVVVFGWFYWGLFLHMSILLMIGTFPLLFCGLLGHIHRRRIPWNSRRIEVSSETALWKAVSSAVVCPRCDSELFISRSGGERVYKCIYCGALGAIEILKSEKNSG